MQQYQFCLLYTSQRADTVWFSGDHEPGFFTAVSLCSADKCLYRMVFNSAGYPRPRGGDAAMVDAFPAGGSMVGERQLEKFVHEPVRDV